MMNIVLVEPEIPANTGNIARTCSVTGAALHLVHPLGFSVDDRHLKRAGLDYWHQLTVYHYQSLDQVLERYLDHNFWLATTRTRRCYTAVQYHGDDLIIFGKETSGLPQDLLDAHRESCIRIPMMDGSRSMNLSNSVAVVLFEALRQQGFPDMI